MGYFFPSLEGTASSSSSSSIWNEDLIDMWRVLDFSVISWEAILDAIPTMVALVLFSLIHVPINIPAFALSTNTEVDMNVELIAHGYSNLISGACFGLQNYMAYTQSVIYDKSGGTGKRSGLVVAAVTAGLYFVGPTVASYIPRCMAGTLLLHVGIDLFLEGVYDSYSKFDRLEYGSVLLIIIVMTVYGMDAAMLAGVLSAIFTFVAQNMTYIDPIRGSMSAATLRSSKRNRNPKARAILDAGRSRILVIQLQGHLFFGNMAHLSKSIHDLMEQGSGGSSGGSGASESPLIVIIDFSLVLGIDSSAAMALTKIKKVMKNQYNVELSVFVSGSTSGFPTDFDLSKELAAQTKATTANGNGEHQRESLDLEPQETTGLLLDIPARRRVYFSSHLEEVEAMIICGSHVSEDLDTALIHAENFLIARHDSKLLHDDLSLDSNHKALLRKSSSLSDEREVGLKYLANLCSRDGDDNNGVGDTSPQLHHQLFARFRRETYLEDDFVWKQGSASTTIKLLVRGTLIAELENEAGTSEIISAGNSIGEVGFIEGVPRLSSVRCVTEDAVVYSLSRESYNELLKESPHTARLLDLICIRYLSARVQHVSNRIFETRCLPI
uniref:STAS domain-containing protein n=1 Tax=Grammatophora oceanica TaxID=210454 RepID=A0A7S1VAN1_9STRA